MKDDTDESDDDIVIGASRLTIRSSLVNKGHVSTVLVFYLFFYERSHHDAVLLPLCIRQFLNQRELISDISKAVSSSFQK